MSITEELDRGERDSKVLGRSDSLFFAAELMGFSSWTHIVRLAREGSAVAIELLCRRVERGL